MQAVQKNVPSKRPCLVFFAEEQLGTLFDEERGRNELSRPLKQLCESKLVHLVVVAVTARRNEVGASAPSEEFDAKGGGVSPLSVLPGVVPAWVLKDIPGAHSKAVVATALSDRKPATHLHTPTSRFVLEEMRRKETLGEVIANPVTGVYCLTFDAGVVSRERAADDAESFARQREADAVLVYLEGHPFPEVGEVMQQINTLREGERRVIEWFLPTAA